MSWEGGDEEIGEVTGKGDGEIIGDRGGGVLGKGRLWDRGRKVGNKE